MDGLLVIISNSSSNILPCMHMGALCLNSWTTNSDHTHFFCCCCYMWDASCSQVYMIVTATCQRVKAKTEGWFIYWRADLVVVFSQSGANKRHIHLGSKEQFSFHRDATSQINSFRLFVYSPIDTLPFWHLNQNNLPLNHPLPYLLFFSNLDKVSATLCYVTWQANICVM